MKLINYGIIRQYGGISGTIENHGLILNKLSTITLSFGNSGATSAAYGDTVTITATAAAQPINKMLSRSRPDVDYMDFCLGSVDSGEKLNAAPVKVTGGKATLSITLTGEDWAVGQKTVSAVFGGGNINLLASLGQSKFEVTKSAPTLAITASAIPMDRNYPRPH